MPESPSVTKGAGVAERQTQSAHNAWGESQCGFDSHLPHAGLTSRSGRAYLANALRTLCVVLVHARQAAERSAAFAFQNSGLPEPFASLLSSGLLSRNRFHQQSQRLLEIVSADPRAWEMPEPDHDELPRWND